MHLATVVFSAAPTHAFVVCVMALTTCIIARAAAAHFLPGARAADLPGQTALPTSGQARDRRRWESRLVGRVRARRSTPIPADHVAVWSDALSRRLRAGDTLRIALEDELPEDRALRTRTDPIRMTLSHGVAVSKAVTAAVTLTSSGPAPARDPHLELLCSVIAATAGFGGSAAAPIDRVGAALRLRSADGQERDAQSAQARLSAHVLTVVPLAVLALLTATDAHVRRFSTGGLGLMVLACGLVLNLTGWFWMKRVVAGEAS